jgi:flagellar hook-length control protein FliK
MIGASFPAPPAPAATAATAVAAAEHAAATTDADTASRADGDAATANGPPRSASPKNGPNGRDAARVDAVAQRGATAQDRKTGDDTSPRGFAELLAANGTVDTITDAATKPAATEPDAAEPPATATLPDQLLALLSGSLAATAKPVTAAPASAAPSGKASTPTLQLPAATTAGALPLAMPATIAATADAGGESFAALAKLAADALVAGSGSTDKPATQAADASSLPDGLALATTTPIAASTRANVVAPAMALAMPADPDVGFDDGFGARIAWMAEQRVGHAEIRLNPEHVGPIDVRVQLDGNRVSAEFHSAHVEVRRAIEASMPQLREMLGQHGLQLGHADVGQRHAQGQAASRGGFVDPAGERDGGDGIAHVPSVAPLRSRGLLDEYA